ncbi:CDP-diacylglycerol--glycerol-3-phosphate 3-phosphatidyltransferase 1, chloroplastic-like [Zingiber officinale]|uniref:CDP-diacylglycerol--glycerol-3-phosphate 3-phosphatidyltransferase 1, chloroplastic-like n=1 Tax=Zingiber officinale TaxID=94328 RepID=UPI001C4B20F7|nr:CDP-diacylglycerol--glycerol-3-phosphate 3-phosphatidyltransferase 1, chloroplastic-like [Zingiber officinale]
MAIFRTLIRSLLRNHGSRSHLSCRTPSSLSPLVSFSPLPLSHSTVASNPFAFVLPLNRSPAPILCPPFRWTPFSGPLFLSSPPWKLLQSATPLYLRGKDAIFPKDLLQVRSFPVELRLISMGEVERGIVRNEIQWREESKEVGSERIDEKLLNLPNLVSISRMVSGPIIGWMIINEWYLPAFGALVVSGATDWLDGFLARKMGIHSVFGSYLDPLADKVLIVCVGLAMLKKDLLNPMLVALIVARDVGLIGGAFYKRAASLGWEWKSWSQFVNLDEMHRHKVEPLLISKVNTVFQLLLVAAALLQPELGNKETQVYITYLSWLVASTTSVSSIAYIVQNLHR